MQLQKLCPQHSGNCTYIIQAWKKFIQILYWCFVWACFWWEHFGGFNYGLDLKRREYRLFSATSQTSPARHNIPAVSKAYSHHFLIESMSVTFLPHLTCTHANLMCLMHLEFSIFRIFFDLQNKNDFFILIVWIVFIVCIGRSGRRYFHESILWKLGSENNN